MSVAGNCDGCKNRIEKAAKEAGALMANWNDSTKILQITYDDLSTSLLTIEKRIALAGHDTRDVKATADAYAKLPVCCKYDKSSIGKPTQVCEEDKKQ